MPFTKSAVELFISALAAAITECGSSDMNARVPESTHWLTQFGLAAIFHDFPPIELRPRGINFIRRVHGAFLQYELARQKVLELVKDGNDRWSPYFVALTHFEVAVGQLYVALDSTRNLPSNPGGDKHQFFKPDDGSVTERLNLIYNASKHELAGAELPVWFTNEGLACKNAALTFDEFEDFMLTMAGVVRLLCDRDIAIKALGAADEGQVAGLMAFARS